MSKFSRNDSPNGSGVGVRKNSLLKYEHIIYSFEARNLEINYFREIFKFRDFMNTKKFREICEICFRSYFRKI